MPKSILRIFSIIILYILVEKSFIVSIISNKIYFLELLYENISLTSKESTKACFLTIFTL